jgi:xanthine dehydrogenase accessory factor
MVDRRRIVRLWGAGRAQALVTLVRVEGSSYRKPGAHLLIDETGECAGMISGGCLEAEVVRRALWMVRNGAVMERYSTLFDDTAELPFGLGCGGVVDLLLEPADTPECRALISAMEASLAGVEMRVTTWLPARERSMRRAIIGVDGAVIFRSEGLNAGDLDSTAPRCVAPLVCDSEIYIDTLCAPQRLFVLGAGEDAKPVVTMASLLGWSVTVVDGRAQLARAERFAEAERVLAISSVAELEITAKDAVVVMTHSYEQDRVYLAELLAGTAGYIGLLGAMHRSSLLIGEAAAQLGRSVAECCERVWAPVGMDLGGDGAEAIALAVVAEVQAWRQGKLVITRRLSAEDVTRQVELGGASHYMQTQCAMGAAER